VAYTLGKTLQNLPGPVLITGHTGFKGTWMTLLLQQLGIPIVGYALKPEQDSLYDRAKLQGQIPEIYADIRNYKKLKKFIEKHKPSVIIHMAAQPLVLESYKIPLTTFDVNVMGTVNLLDLAFKAKTVKCVLVVTSDKVYRNDNFGRRFVETDALEGEDPYSASKVATEAAVKAWQKISEEFEGPKIVSVRAGNVIGGGDFAENRLIPDLVKSVLIKKENFVIRNPESTRPWQHVLDPLAGYILALESSLLGKSEPSYNFAPKDQSLSVREVAESFIKLSGSKVNLIIEQSGKNLEASTLNLDVTKSNKELNWDSFWNQPDAVAQSYSWWSKVLNQQDPISQVCNEEIKLLIQFFKNRGD
jgi:CDP-glucose 4,6-dehydratase